LSYLDTADRETATARQECTWTEPAGSGSLALPGAARPRRAPWRRRVSPGPAPPEPGAASWSIRGAVGAVVPAPRGVMPAEPGGPFAAWQRWFARI